MWNRLTSVLKRGETEVPRAVTPQPPSHPEDFDLPGRSQSLDVPDVSRGARTPPGSPSKSGRHVRRRPSRAAEMDGPTSSSLRLFPKKVKSTLTLNGNASRSQTSLARGSSDISRDVRPSLDVGISLASGPAIAEEPASPPNNAITDAQGSVRSILKDPKAPGSGQNVRFFSRDAYRLISPDTSATSSEVEPPSALAMLDKLDSAFPTRTRPSVTNLFIDTERKDLPEPPFATSSSMLQLPPPDVTNIFNMSQHNELPPIPQEQEALLQNVIDVMDNGTNGQTVTSTPAKSTESEEAYIGGPPGLEPSPIHQHDRSQSFSFGQTVFHSAAKASPTSAHSSSSSAVSGVKSRSRALSDTMFQALIRASSASASSVSSDAPEADINDESSQELIVYKPSEPDPFRANATTYYTPQTLIPPSPPQAEKTHVRKTSKEEDVIWSLRTQLAVQQELCTQYEIDLAARDELVDALKGKLESVERDGKERRNATRAWRKKVAELEKACRCLEEEVDRSRAESFERSVMDEASGTALRELQRRIAGLEREKEVCEKREADALEEKKALERRLQEREESQKALQEGIRMAQEEMANIGNISLNFNGSEGEEELRKLVLEKEKENEEEKEKHRTAEFEWIEERMQLMAEIRMLCSEKEEAAVSLQDAHTQLDELAVLKEELHAQWKHMEAASARIEELTLTRTSLENERDSSDRELEHLRDEMSTKETQICELEECLDQTEKTIQELQEKLDSTQSARIHVDEQVAHLEELLAAEREHVQDVKGTLHDCEDRASQLEEEVRSLTEQMNRLRSHDSELNEELSESSQKIMTLERMIESLQHEIDEITRRHESEMTEQIHAMQETAMREGAVQAQLAALEKEKAETDSMLESLREKATQVDKYAKSIQELKQENADQEVKIVQLTKTRAHDKEILDGLNIALDSKQQELELVKRRFGVKGTGGSTPAEASRVAHHRRESSMFSTPATLSRPSSSLSTTHEKERDRKLDTQSTLMKSHRTNNVAPLSRAAGGMGPPSSKPRPSMGTPTPMGHTRAPSSFTKPASATAAAASSSSLRRRDSSTSVTSDRNVTSPAQSDASVRVANKENVSAASAKASRRTSVPVPA